MGINGLGNLPKLAATYLDKAGTHTGYSFRHSSATALAKSGISVIGLCHAGRWNSVSIAQEYLEDTTIEKQEICDRFDGKYGEVDATVLYKMQKVKDNGSNGSLDSPAVVHGNSYVINISGGGSYSFLNGGLSGATKNEAIEE